MSTQDFNEEIFVIDDYCDFFNESFFKTTDSHRHNEITEIIGKPLTLSRVLLALKNKEVKTCYGGEIIFNIAGSQFCGLQVSDKDDGSYDTIYTLYGICLWNLALGEIEITLEEQTEETQRKINELFNN